MHLIRQSSRDYWELKLFCIGVLWLALCYGFLSVTIHILPPLQRIAPNAPIIIPILFSLVSFGFVGSIMRVVWPLTFSTEIDTDRIQFRDSRKEYASTVVSRTEVQYFRVE